jgi:inorganic triphosphatase YgiF
MAVEREHKFLVAGGFPALAQLRAVYEPHGLGLRAGGVRDQSDLYYDTPDMVLLHAGVALRIRRFDAQVLATYKGAGQVRGSHHAREEIELPYVAPWPPAIMTKLAPLGVLDRLEPLVQLRPRRSRYLLVEGAEPRAELSFDEVTASHGAQQVAFDELELEAHPDVSDDAFERLVQPLSDALSNFGLSPHAGDKLSHALTLLGLLDGPADGLDKERGL